MNFLNGGLFLALAPLLALPLAIHLFNRHYPRAIRFPDLERLRKSLSERSKLIRWRHVLMTLLRTLVVVLALLAFLKPVLPRFGSQPGAEREKGRRVLLVLDRSLSMRHQAGARASAEKNALVEAGKILATLDGEDRANAVVAGNQARTLLPEFTPDHDRVRTALAALPATYERTEPGRAVALVSTLLEGEAAGAEVYFLSDFQRSNWADATFDGLPEGVRLFFVNTVGDGERANAALLSAEPSATRVAMGESIRLEITAANWSDEPVTLPVEAIVDGRSSVGGEIPAAAWSTGRVTLELAAPDEEGIHTIDVRIPKDDGLAADNHRYLKLEVQHREEVLVFSDEKAEDSGALFVATALDPFENRSAAYAPRVLPLAQLEPGPMSTTSKVVFTGVGSLDDEQARRLVAFLENGGGLIYFLDGAADGANIEALEKAAGRPVTPFHVAGKLTTENFGGKPQKIARGEFRSPFLRLFRGENRQALSLLEFYEIQRALPAEEGEIILHFADGSPALGVSDIGLGTAVFCNFTPAELSSNLARQRLFPAWVQELVKHLTPEIVPETTTETGSPVTADVWQRDIEAAPLTGPDGEQISARLVPDGERVQATFDAARPGIYRLGAANRSAWAAAVNVSAEESDLRAIDPEELQARARVSGEDTGHFVEGAGDYEELTSGRPVFHWFLLGMAALLLVEMLLYRPFRLASGTG
ncbi:MAG: BatA and WFA domain-containing protein [Verrucomicrobiales bacterium]